MDIEDGTLQLSNSTLKHYISSEENGAALLLVNSNATIEDCMFQNNTASKGGAIAFECDLLEICTLNLLRNTFKQNNALEGGAIYYSLFKPSIDASNIFKENTATNYGADVSSYPAYVTLLNATSEASVGSASLLGAASGQVLSSLVFGLLDADQNLMADKSSNMIVRAVAANTYVSGETQSTLSGGIATFADLVLISDPGSIKTFEVENSAIERAKVGTALGLSTEETANSNKLILSVEFRECIPGEELLNGK